MEERPGCFEFFCILSRYYFLTQDHGIFRDGSKDISESQQEQYKRTLSQDLNRQGAVILEGRTVGKVFFDTNSLIEDLIYKGNIYQLFNLPTHFFSFLFFLSLS